MASSSQSWVALRGTLRFTLIRLAALLAGPSALLASTMTAPLAVPDPTVDAQLAAPHHAQPLAFDLAPPAPAGLAKNDAGTPPAGTPSQRRAGPHAGRFTAADARARAAARRHRVFVSLRHARRANRHIFGSTRPPPLL